MGLVQTDQRPKRFSEIVGHPKALQALMSQHGTGRFPSALMFAGPPGLGKTTLARIVALSLCINLENFGEPTDEDWSQWEELSIAEIDGAAHNKVEDAQELAKIARFAPQFPSKRRVIILDEAQRLTPQAQELLLKPLEEAKKTVWIICTTEPGKLKEAVRRRCYRLDLQGLSDKSIRKLLIRTCKAAKIKVDLQPLLDELIQRDVGSPGWILNSLERYAAGMPVKEAVATGDIADAEVFPAVQALAKGDYAGVVRGLPAKVDVEVARKFRAIACSYLRSLMNQGGAKGLGAANAIMEFNRTVALDETLLGSTVMAAAFLACNHLKGSPAASKSRPRW